MVNGTGFYSRINELNALFPTLGGKNRVSASRGRVCFDCVARGNKFFPWNFGETRERFDKRDVTMREISLPRDSIYGNPLHENLVFLQDLFVLLYLTD